MKWMPVPAARLRRRPLTSAARCLRKATLLPFFDRGGRVTRLLLLDHELGEVLTTPVQADGIRVTLMGRVRCSGQTVLRRLDPVALEQLAVLWHYDPWWLLTASPYDNHWATSTLKATNVVPFLPSTVRRVYFRRDLTAISGVATCEGDEVRLKAWQSAFLPSQHPCVLRTDSSQTWPAGTPSWALDPVWTNQRRVVYRTFGNQTS